MIYRVKQFLWGLTAKLAKQDILFVNGQLDATELGLFFALPKNEQLHSVKVGLEVQKQLALRNMESKLLIKAALLHDIGKLNSGLNIWSKSIIVIADKAAPSMLSKFKSIKAVNAYYNHAALAMRYLDHEEEELKYYIVNHHNHDIKDNLKLTILQQADSKN